LYLNHTGPYPLFLSEEYPKFLIENFNLTDLEKLKMQAQSEESHHKIAEFAEKKRLHQEIQSSAQKIHNTRLDGKVYIYITFMKIFN
jgi:hypothetical protein